MKIGIRNAGTVAVTSLRAHVSAPSVSDSPALSTLERLAPGEERRIDVPLALAEDPGPSELTGKSLHVAVLVSYQRGREGVSVRGSLDIPVSSVEPRPTPADLLACGITGGDQMVAGLADDLLAGPSPGTEGQDPLAGLAAILDSLGSLRGRAARAVRAAAATDGGGAGGSAGGNGGLPQAARGSAGGVRGTLRGLSPDEGDWTLVTLCVAATVGLPVGIVSWQDRSFALVDTGIARTDAMTEVPGLSRYAAVLDSLARGGTLCVPLSGSTPPATDGAVGWALADALRDCVKRDMKTAKVWWRDTASSVTASRPVAMPIPFPLPAIRVAPSRDTLRAEIIQSLEQYK